MAILVILWMSSGSAARPISMGICSRMFTNQVKMMRLLEFHLLRLLLLLVHLMNAPKIGSAYGHHWDPTKAPAKATMFVMQSFLWSIARHWLAVEGRLRQIRYSISFMPVPEQRTTIVGMSNLGSIWNTLIWTYSEVIAMYSFYSVACFLLDLAINIEELNFPHYKFFH